MPTYGSPQYGLYSGYIKPGIAYLKQKRGQYPTGFKEQMTPEFIEKEIIPSVTNIGITRPQAVYQIITRGRRAGETAGGLARMVQSVMKVPKEGLKPVKDIFFHLPERSVAQFARTTNLPYGKGEIQVKGARQFAREYGQPRPKYSSREIFPHETVHAAHRHPETAFGKKLTGGRKIMWEEMKDLTNSINYLARQGRIDPRVAYDIVPTEIHARFLSNLTARPGITTKSKTYEDLFWNTLNESIKTSRRALKQHVTTLKGYPFD